ncbi:MAG: hypothetical protein AAFX87_24195 [Bacteroidota bacterium]
MLTLNDFRTLPFEKKCEFITFCGNYIAHRKVGDEKIYLYNLGGFFIEVRFAPFQNRVIGISAFRETNRLKPYYDQVDLTGLGV